MMVIYDDESEPPKKKKDIENWANSDRIPVLPTPGQILEQKKGKKV